MTRRRLPDPLTLTTLAAFVDSYSHGRRPSRFKRRTGRRPCRFTRPRTSTRSATISASHPRQPILTPTASDPARHKFIYLATPKSPRGLLTLLAHALGLEPAWTSAELSQQVKEALCRLDEHGVTPVLLADEAQLAPASVLDELRLCCSTAMDARSAAAIVLCGHQSLRRRLALESLAPLAQRVIVTTTLTGLSGPQTASYIEHQLAWAGADRPLFTREVVELVAHHSRGLPRQINRLCTASLLAAFAVHQPLVEEPAFRQALKAVDPESA